MHFENCYYILVDNDWMEEYKYHWIGTISFNVYHYAFVKKKFYIFLGTLPWDVLKAILTMISYSAPLSLAKPSSEPLESHVICNWLIQLYRKLIQKNVHQI